MSIGFVLKKFLSIIKKKFENLENIRNFCGQKWTKKGKKNVHALESQLAKVCILKEGIRNQFYCIESSSLQICFILDKLIRINGFILQGGKKD